MAYRTGRWGLRLQSQRTAIPVNLLKISDSCSGGTPPTLPQISKMHHMMFFLFLTISLCMAINLSLNEAYILTNHTASRFNLTSPCWICINGRGWGMSNLSQGINGPPFQPSYMLLLSAPHLIAVWPFGKKGKKTSCLGMSNSCLYLPPQEHLQSHLSPYFLS